MTGIVISGGGIGAFIGPPVINWLINISNWRQTTIILGIFVFIVIFLAAQFLKRDPSQVGQDGNRPVTNSQGTFRSPLDKNIYVL